MKISQSTFVMKIPLNDEVKGVFEPNIHAGSAGEISDIFGNVYIAPMAEVESDETEDGIFYI